MLSKKSLTTLRLISRRKTNHATIVRRYAPRASYRSHRRVHRFSRSTGRQIEAITHYSLQVAQDVAPERVDMGTHRVLGSLDVTVADRLENLVVLIVDAALMIRRGQRNEPQPQ